MLQWYFSIARESTNLKNWKYWKHPVVMAYWTMDHYKYLGSVLTRYGYSTREIKTWITMAKGAFSRKISPLTRKLNTELRKKFVKSYDFNIAMYGSETWTVRKLEWKYVQSFKMCCWRRMKKIKSSEKVNNQDDKKYIKMKEREWHLADSCL